jgi:hypothetical protein
LLGGFWMQLQFMQMLSIMMVIVAQYSEICNKLIFYWSIFSLVQQQMSTEVSLDYLDSVDRIKEIYQNIESVQKKICTVSSTPFDDEEKTNLLSV